MKNRNFIHLIYIPFRDVGVYDRFRDDVWFAERIEIFKQYTLKSLLNQENRNFILWISFRPQDRSNILVKNLKFHLQAVRVKYIFTYDGLMYWDDKFSGNLWSKILNCARVARFCFRNRSLKKLMSQVYEILFYDKNASLGQRLDSSLKVIENEFKEVDLVYVTRLDSDDMFHKFVIKEIQLRPQYKEPVTRERKIVGYPSLVFNKGYVYDRDTEQLAEWLPKTNSPFHTMIFPASTFFNSKKHKEYYGEYKSHEDIEKILPSFSFILPNYRYCVLTHNTKNQISTIFNHPFRGKLLENKEEILKEFGI